ncbi:hypothetical protein Bca52824_003716 [Brassica carinata]|uniref:RNase H type-1 domain-containing protein n=1 Tax=Brassica carinata TaxID=52824 RepID=A0A8X7WLN8_BRACI|nr:hypothetical protein Bca52824_003716 [Brassica carinata]
MKVDPRCQRCGSSSESINHVLLSCPVARLVWAQIGFPFPPRGFEHRSLLENFDYLLGISTRKEVPGEISRVFPWVVWLEATVNKIQDDCRHWFEVVQAGENSKVGSRNLHLNGNRWRPPSAGKLKCNLGIAWSKGKSLAGTSWIVRDARGEVLMHSRRRAFSGIHSLLEAKHFGLTWAIESMLSHKIVNVCLEIEASELVGVVKRPKAWPAFRA